MGESAKKRLNYLNVIRLVSFAVIICFHIVVELADRKLLGAGTETMYSNCNLHFATAAVSLFFMISGASLMLSSGVQKTFRIGAYYKKRAQRILIPYYVASLIPFVISCHGRIPAGIPKWTVLLNLFAMDGYAKILGFNVMYLVIGEWFLGCLMLIYLVFPLLRFLVVRFPRAVFLIATAVYVLLVFWDPFPIPAEYNVLFKGYDFLLGMYLFLYGERISKKVLFAVVPFVLWMLFLPVELPMAAICRITVFAAAVFILAQKLEPVFASGRRFGSICAGLCRYSYEIFLIHHLVIVGMINRVWSVYRVPFGLPGLIAAMVIVSVVLGILIHFVSAGIIRLGGKFRRKQWQK